MIPAFWMPIYPVIAQDNVFGVGVYLSIAIKRNLRTIEARYWILVSGYL